MSNVMVSLEITYPKSPSDIKREDELFTAITYNEAIKIMNDRVSSIREARFNLRHLNTAIRKDGTTGVMVFNWQVGAFVPVE